MVQFQYLVRSTHILKKKFGSQIFQKWRTTAVYPQSVVGFNIVKICHAFLYPRDHKQGRTHFNILNMHAPKVRTWSLFWDTQRSDLQMLMLQACLYRIMLLLMQRDMKNQERRSNYRCDITYTNNTVSQSHQKYFYLHHFYIGVFFPKVLIGFHWQFTWSSPPYCPNQCPISFFMATGTWFWLLAR